LDAQIKKLILASTYYISCLYNRWNKYPIPSVILATDVIGAFFYPNILIVFAIRLSLAPLSI